MRPPDMQSHNDIEKLIQVSSVVITHKSSNWLVDGISLTNLQITFYLDRYSHAIVYFDCLPIQKEN
jgi:hypothetical protein